MYTMGRGRFCKHEEKSMNQAHFFKQKEKFNESV